MIATALRHNTAASSDTIISGFHGTKNPRSCLRRAARAGPQREFKSSIRGRELRRATSVQTPIAVRAKLAFRRNAPLLGRPHCPRQSPFYTILPTHAASCCSLRVRAPAPPGWATHRSVRKSDSWSVCSGVCPASTIFFLHARKPGRVAEVGLARIINRTISLKESHLVPLRTHRHNILFYHSVPSLALSLMHMSG